MKTTTAQWLFHPFEYISEIKALSIGFMVILLSGIINYFTNSHFDGVIDFHTGSDETYSFQLYIYEGFLDWLLFALLLFVAGKILSSSSIRFIDILSMQALARFPFLIVSLGTLVLPNPAVYDYLLQKMSKDEITTVVPSHQWIFFAINTVLILLCSVWIVMLMYRAYTVACNLKGTKAIVSFIITFLIAEIAIKLLFGFCNEYFLISQKN